MKVLEQIGLTVDLVHKTNGMTRKDSCGCSQLNLGMSFHCCC
uniref:Uncharacterized protein n=1 Tax=Rhizophora mucronata TaxID=61149 RepID=A0A2P2MYW2_RHIMU